MKKHILASTVMGMMLGLPATQASANCLADRACMSDPVCYEQCVGASATTEGCSSAPAVAISDFPTELMPGAKNLTVTIDIAGSVAKGDSCKLKKAWLDVEDEYGEKSKKGQPVSVDNNGKYAAKIDIEARARGRDKDGRDYRFTVYAENEAGVGQSPTFKATVAHDRRKK